MSLTIVWCSGLWDPISLFIKRKIILFFCIVWCGGCLCVCVCVGGVCRTVSASVSFVFLPLSFPHKVVAL